LAVRGVRGKRWYTHLFAPLWTTAALLQALFVILRTRPAAVLGMGGFVAGPGGLAAWLLHRPLLLHEQNAVPGLTNRWLARFAGWVMEGFPGAFDGHVRATFTGNPVRPAIASLASPEARLSDRLSGREGPLRVLVLGGSQGAQVLNEVVPEALAQLKPEERPQVWHQTGTQQIARTRQRYRQLGVEVREARLAPFIKEMDEAYGWADLVVCRAGALTVAELAAAGIGSVLVPYPYAVDDHQTRNALYLVEGGAAVLLPQSQLTASRMGALLRDFNEHRGRLLEMAHNARLLAQSQAAARVADIVVAAASAEAVAQKPIKGSSNHA
jgi:UDP-N-acetylglucosamine--N-acetylmuramyl-(pentapeptide) pyrophosphoryl-undecaprenol N-acetylglucosamine transferase